MKHDMGSRGVDRYSVESRRGFKTWSSQAIKGYVPFGVF